MVLTSAMLMGTLAALAVDPMQQARRVEPATPGQLRFLKNNSPAVVNQTLTTYAQGLTQDLGGQGLADFIAPWVVTGVASGQYKSYDDKNAFQVLDTRRAIGDKRAEIKFDASDPAFLCLPHGLQIALDDYELQQAGTGDGAFPIKQAKTTQLVNAAMRSREKLVWDQVKAGKAATGGIGVWSNAANDPIAEIDSQIQAIANDTGLMPNRIVFGLSAWAVIRKHPKVTALKSGVNSSGLTLGEFASMLLNPAIEVKVGVIPYDTAAKGVAKANANIVGSEVFIFFGQNQPDTVDPSFAKTFSVDGNGVNAVKEFRQDDLVTKIAVDWSEQVKVTAALSGKRITIT